MKELNLIGCDKYGYGQRNYSRTIDKFLLLHHTYNLYKHIWNLQYYQKNAVNHVLVGIPLIKKAEILTVNDIAFNYPNFVRERVFARALIENVKRADRLIVFTNFMKNEVERFYQNKDITVLPFGIDLIEFSYGLAENMARIFDKEYDVLIVSNLDQRKNILPYLKALSKTFLRVRLIGKVVDKKLSESIMKIVKESTNISYSVSVPSIQVEYIKSKVLLHSALYGGFEIPIAESSLMKVNTLVYDYPLNRELYGSAPNYLPYEEPTSNEMIETILQAIDSNNYRRMSEIVRKNHDIRKTIKTYEKFYEGIL